MPATSDSLMAPEDLLPIRDIGILREKARLETLLVDCRN